ncbi:hypothetical protein EYR38_010808 [Pleurotus pulmonarius]|nr:hypothetical protein EYR38_010808 [Pleurotus pulmonarius]
MAGFTHLALFCVAAMLTASPFAVALPSTKSSSDLLPSAQEFNVDIATATDQITFSHCTPAQERTISDAIPIAQRWALEAVTYLNNIDGNGTVATDARYKIWFGEYTPARFKNVMIRAAALRTAHFDHWTYECTPDCGLMSALTHAFVLRATPSTVNLCPLFWKYDADERAATLIHEASHFSPAWGEVGTNAYTWEFYGAQLARVLAHTSPDRAIVNAENYAFFARYRVGCEAPGSCAIL